MVNDAAYELDGIYALLNGLYQQYLERPYDKPLVDEELKEFTAAYGICLSAINKKRHEFDAMWKSCTEVAK